jgi:hypothetical protein
MPSALTSSAARCNVGTRRPSDIAGGESPSRDCLRIWVIRSRAAPAGGLLGPSQIARRVRRRSRSGVWIRMSRPAARSSATASSLMTAGAAPASTAERTAAVVDSDSAGGGCTVPGPSLAASAAVRVSRVPEPPSLLTRGVPASSAAPTPLRRRAQGWPGATTRASRSWPMTWLGSPAGWRGPSVKPMSARPSMTWVTTISVLAAVSTISGTCWPRPPTPARKEASQAGSSCSAMVELALTRSRSRRSWRNAARPASSPAATSSSRAAHSAITAPSAVRVEPRGVRCTSTTPVCASIARIRAETACWLTPISRAAPFRLPLLATSSSTSSAARSGTWLLIAIPPA